MRILFITAHPDDLEFGCGGTLNKLASGKDYVEVHVFSTSEGIEGNQGIQDECKASISDIYKVDLHMYKYPTMHFVEYYQEIRDRIFAIKQEMKPDVVYCKSPNSLHPDHRVIGESCESIFLEQTIYGIEGVRDGHNQRINKWVEITEDDLNVKIDAIACYKTQNRRSYSNSKVIEAWARMRGNQVGLEFAEGFEVIRLVS